jgi:GEVED domain/Pregnancy-associated plasma protein-A
MADHLFFRMREDYHLILFDLFTATKRKRCCACLVSLLIILSVFTSVFAQNQIESCGNVGINPNDIELDNAILKKAKKSLRFSTTAATINIPIKLHIVRNTNGSTSFDLKGFLDSFAELNNKFKKKNIQFYLLDNIVFIDNTDLYTYEAQNEETLLCDPNDVLNAVNMYYVNTVLFFNGLYAAGYAYYPSPSKNSNRIIMTNNSLNTTRTLSHEMGHYLNLLHTYHNNTSATLKEKVSRTNSPNCTTAGDMLCDTPADPYGLPGATTSGCLYSGMITDENGDLYTPLINNTMSYYSQTCGDLFSPMQYDRIVDGYILRSLPTNAYKIDYVASSVATPINLTSSIVASKVRLSFTDLANNEIGFLIERKLNPTDEFKIVGHLFENETIYTDNDVASNTTYIYRVRAINSAVYSNESTITTTITYCVPKYDFNCDAFPVNLEQFAIVGTSLNKINSGCSPNSYSKITTNTPDLNIDQVYTLNASVNTTTGNSYFAQHCTIWIDYNVDGNFTNDEIIFKTNSTASLDPARSATFRIPLTATSGSSILRVRTQYADDGLVNDACSVLQFGETEDYTVNIKAAAVLNDIKISAITPASVCTDASLNIVYQKIGTMALDSTTFIVQIGDASGTFQNLITQTSGNTLTALIPAGQLAGNYRVRVISNSPSLIGTEGAGGLIIKSKPASGIDLIGAICINQATTFNALPIVSGATYSWTFGSDASPANASTSTGSVQWASSGTKTVGLTVTSNGCSSSYSKTVEVCLANGFIVKAKFLPEGLWNGTSLRTDLLTKNLLPKQQPFNQAPWNYSGSESLVNFPANTSDWIFVVARRLDGTVLAKKAALIRNDGVLMNIDGSEGINMGALTGDVYASFHHKSHIPVMTTIVLTNNVLYDFTTTQSQAKGTAQQKLVSSAWCMYAGDLDQNCLNNNLDFNAWKTKGAAINQYLNVDADCNGIVNNLDANLWMRNRSKVGVMEVRGF